MQKAAALDRPFFLHWDPSEPHLPNVVPEPFASMYRPESIRPWVSYPDPLIDKPYIQQQQRYTWNIAGWTWSDWAPIVSRYLGEITLLDAQIGRILDTLDDAGLAQETMVVYTADHGDLCGGHGLIDKHFVMYDELVRVPLIVRWPSVITPGQSNPAFVCSALDLATTFCHAAGVQPPSTFMGTNLFAALDDDDPTGSNGIHRSDIFATYHGNQLGLYSQRMVRDRRWKYIWNATAEDELYDLANDPGEIVNRADDLECEPELHRLRGRLIDWMECTHDRLLNVWTRRQLSGGIAGGVNP